MSNYRLEVKGFKKFFIFEGVNIKPETISYKGTIKNIKKVPNEYFKVSSYMIVTNNDLLEDLMIGESFHPNASENPNGSGVVLDTDKIPPKVQFFCLPENMKNKRVDENNVNFFVSYFETLLKTYNYDSSYWIRWNDFELDTIQEVFTKEEVKKNDDTKNLVVKDIYDYIYKYRPFDQSGPVVMELTKSVFSNFVSSSNNYQLQVLNREKIEICKRMLSNDIKKEVIKFISWKIGGLINEQR